MRSDTPFSIKSKVWIEDDSGKVIFGLGRFRTSMPMYSPDQIPFLLPYLRN